MVTVSMPVVKILWFPSEQAYRGHRDDDGVVVQREI